MGSIAFVGMDVHKATIAVAVAEGVRGGEVRQLGIFPNRAEVIAKLAGRLAGDGRELSFCYEAGPCGYGLQRQLEGLGHACVVVAPSLIPSKPGDPAEDRPARRAEPGEAAPGGRSSASLPRVLSPTSRSRPKRRPPNSTYKAVLRVGHGCEGKPTTAIRVKIPEGVIAVKPMPKPGWQLATTKGKYAKPYDYYGTPLTEGVTEVAWTGGELPDEWYDEFVLRGQLTGFAPGTVVYFPVVQECTDGAAHRWIEIPAPGKSEDDYEEPAPGVTIVDMPADAD